MMPGKAMRAMRGAEVPAESDRFGTAPHPRDTVELFGHAAAERELLDAFRSTRMHHAWIIGGREGIGKATLAWRLTRFVMAHPDAATPFVRDAGSLAIDPGDPAARRISAQSQPDLAILRRGMNDKTKKFFTEIRVEDARRATTLFQKAPTEGGWRVLILDSAEDLNLHGANALLKTIEEPPPRSLFLLIAHKPGRVLPTIRSRARTLLLDPLSTHDVERALGAMPSLNVPSDRLRAAAARSGGSVRDALKLLGEGGLDLIDRVDAALARLPSVDWRQVHAIADMVARDRETALDTLLGLVFDWLDTRLRLEAGSGARRLAPVPEVWEKISLAVRETEALNLDRRPFVLTLFADLARAARATSV